VAEW